MLHYLSGGLKNHSISSDEGRSKLRDGQVYRVVEGRNCKNNTERNLKMVFA